MRAFDVPGAGNTSARSFGVDRGAITSGRCTEARSMMGKFKPETVKF